MNGLYDARIDQSPVKAGEQTLLPRVRDASEHTLILTDGFSCRSQIDHGTGRGALHLPQAIQMALKEGPNGPATPRPEQRYAHAPGSPNGEITPVAVLAAGAAAAAVGGVAELSRRRRGRRRTRLSGS